MGIAAWDCGMARMVKRTLLLVLLLVSGYAGVNFLYWYQVRGAVDQLVAEVAPYVKVRYDSLSADFDGVIALRGLSLAPLGAAGVVTVNELRVATPGWQYLLNARRRLVGGNWPQELDANFRGVELVLNAENVPLVDRQIARLLPQDELVGALVMACGAHQPLSLQQMKEMGVERLTGDLQLRYRLDPLSRRMTAVVALHAAQLFQLESELSLRFAHDNLSRQLVASFSPLLQQASLSYIDRGYHARRNAYCARLRDEPVTLYTLRHRARVAALLADRGWHASHATALDYELLLLQGGALQLTLQPEGPLPLSELGRFIAESRDPLLDLNLQLALNRRSVDLLAMQPAARLTLQDGYAAAAAITQLTAQEAPGAGLVSGPDSVEMRRARTQAVLNQAISQPQTVQSADPRSYQAAPVAQVETYVGKLVRLETYYGRHVEGTLVKIQGARLYIEQHLEQGRAVYPIDKTKVSDLQVYQ